MWIIYDLVIAARLVLDFIFRFRRYKTSFLVLAYVHVHVHPLYWDQDYPWREYTQAAILYNQNLSF